MKRDDKISSLFWGIKFKIVGILIKIVRPFHRVANSMKIHGGYWPEESF